jgi:hypothetical protein
MIFNFTSYFVFMVLPSSYSMGTEGSSNSGEAAGASK